MTDQWAPSVKNLGFDGIHWDTLGRIAGDYAAETHGIHAFIQTAKPGSVLTLQRYLRDHHGGMHEVSRSALMPMTRSFRRRALA